MQPAWSKATAALNEIRERPYTEFSLYTEKGVVHGWQLALSLRTIAPYAPRDWSKLADIGRAKEFDEATEVILITNDPVFFRHTGRLGHKAAGVTVPAATFPHCAFVRRPPTSRFRSPS